MYASASAVAETEEDEERAEQLIAQTEAVYKRKHCYRTEMFQLQDACIAEKENVNEALITHAALMVMQSTAARVGMLSTTGHRSSNGEARGRSLYITPSGEGPGGGGGVWYCTCVAPGTGTGTARYLPVTFV